MHLSQVVANSQSRSVSVLSFPARIKGMGRISLASHVGWPCDCFGQMWWDFWSPDCKPGNFCFRPPRTFALSCCLGKPVPCCKEARLAARRGHVGG